MRDEPDPLIEQTAIHMSEAGDTWPKITPSLREGWRYLAQRAAEVLRPGIGSRESQAVPDEHLLIDAQVVLTKHSGSLTNRRADATMREIIARDWIAQLRRSGYQITFGPGAGHHSTPKSAEVRDDA